MQSKIKLLVPLFVVLLAVLAITFTFYKPAQTQEPLPTVWGHVTYSNEDCDFSDYDTVYVRPKGGSVIAKTTVYYFRLHYEYDFGEFLEQSGDYELYGLQGNDGCGTDVYEFYFDGQHTVRQDIDFDIAP